MHTEEEPISSAPAPLQPAPEKDDQVRVTSEKLDA